MAAAGSYAALSRSGRAVLIYRCPLIERGGRGRDAALLRQPAAQTPRGRRAAGERGPARGRPARRWEAPLTVVAAAAVSSSSPAVRCNLWMWHHVSSGAGRSLRRGMAGGSLPGSRGRERSRWSGAGRREGGCPRRRLPGLLPAQPLGLPSEKG